MKRCTTVLACLLALSLWIDVVAAQPPDGPGRQRGERRRSSRGPEERRVGARPGPPGGPEGRGPGRGFVPPLMAALDVDKDGEISAKEIEGAVKALKKMDKNGDGRLTQDELLPPRGGPGGGDMAERIMGFDEDKDGRVTKDELPERMQERMFERADANGDGFIDKQEAEKMAEQVQGRGGPSRRAGRGQGGPGGRPPGDARPQRPDEG